jgi:hypothetical protein
VPIAGSVDDPHGKVSQQLLLREIENIREEYRAGRQVLSPPVLTMATA